MECVELAENNDDPNLDLDPPEDDPVDEQDQDQQDDQGDEGEDQQVLRTQDQGDQQDRRTGEDRQPSRRDRRIETLTNSLAEERQARAELNRRLDAILAGQNNRPSPGETPEQRAQRLALLTPEERIQETLREDRERHSHEMRTLQFSIVDGNDRAAFEAKATVDPLYGKWKPKVEAELAELRSKGMTADREKIMYYLIGKTAVEGRKGSSERRQAQQRVERQRTRPSNSGSDVQTSRRDRSSSLERRLENQLL